MTLIGVIDVSIELLALSGLFHQCLSTIFANVCQLFSPIVSYNNNSIQKSLRSHQMAQQGTSVLEIFLEAYFQTPIDMGVLNLSTCITD